MATCTVEQENLIVSRYVGTPLYVALINDATRSTYTFSVDTATDIVTTAANTFTDQTRVTVDVSGGGALPAPLTANTTYYWQRLSSTTGKFSLTRSGAAIDITTAGTGILNITDKALDQTVRDVADYTRQELTDYQGQVLRPTVTPSGTPFIAADPITGLNYVQLPVSTVIANATGVSDLVFNGLLVIRGGTTAIGNTTGTPVDYTTLSSLKVLPVGQSDSYSFTIRYLIASSTVTA